MHCMSLQMDTMANQMPHNMGQPEGPVTEDPGLSAAFWQERSAVS